MQKADDTRKICENCGAEYEYKEPCCPYCGTVNEIGAEQQYMNKLQDLKQNLGNMRQVVPNAYAQEIRSTGRRTGIAAAIIIVALILIIGSFVFIQHYRVNVLETREMKSQLLWEQQYFPQLDEWYDNQEFDKILEFQMELYTNEETKDISLYRWKHIQFIRYYERYVYLQKLAAQIDDGETIWDSEKSSALYSSLNLIYVEETSEECGIELTDNIDLLKEYGIYADEFLQNYLGMSEAQISDAYAQTTEEGIISFKACESYAKQLAWKQ